ncbi:MAG: hypothetical protein ACRBB3_06560 [Alphaproteobacteria bacterium]
MTENIDTPQDTQILKLSLSEEYKDNAMNKVKEMVKGNKLNPEDVTLEKMEGEILHFQAENMLTIVTKNSHKTVSGRIEGPILVDNQQAVIEAMNHEYFSLSSDIKTEKKIREVLLNREDQGFALNNNVIPLPFWKREFVVYEACQTCRAQGSVTCQPCAGKGIDQCPRCNGSGIDHCGHCNGAQMIQGPQGNQVQCPVCNGSGHLSCRTCGQSGSVKCSVCRSKGITSCPNCKGSAWLSVVFVQEIEARTSFDYPKNRLPEKVVAMIEKHGAKIKAHAKIDISQDMVSTVNSDDPDKAKKFEEDNKNNNYIIPIIYEVYLPYGHMEFNISGNTYYTFLFGTQEKLTHVSPFLDDVLRNGLRKLSDAVENRGNLIENLLKAAEYRTIKEGITYTTGMHSLSKAKRMLLKSNPLGLSNETAISIIKNTDFILQNITKKPRNIGLFVSSILSLSLLLIYLMSPLRNIITSHIPNQNLHIIIDVIYFLFSSYMGITSIKMICSSTIKKFTKHLGIKKISSPRLGDTLYWAMLLSSSAFIASLETARRFGSYPPFWYINLF